MFLTDYGDDYLAGHPFGGFDSGEELEPAPIDTVAVGTGGEPMSGDPVPNAEHALTNEVYRATSPAQEVYHERDDDVPNIVTKGIEFIHGRQLALGTEITEIALIVSDPQVSTDVNGDLLDQIVVEYDFGTPVVLGSQNPDTADGEGPRPSSTSVGLPLIATKYGGGGTSTASTTGGGGA